MIDGGVYVQTDDWHRLHKWLTMVKNSERECSLMERSLLLYGSSLVGKTRLAKTVCASLGLVVEMVSCDRDWLAFRPGMAEKDLREKCRRATSHVLLVKHVDALFPIEAKRQDGEPDPAVEDLDREWDRERLADLAMMDCWVDGRMRLVSTWWSELRWNRSCGSKGGLLAVIATSQERLPGFSCMIHVHLPQWDARRAFLCALGEHVALADATPGYTFADLKEAVRWMRMTVREKDAMKGAKLMTAHLQVPFALKNSRLSWWRPNRLRAAPALYGAGLRTALVEIRTLVLQMRFDTNHASSRVAGVLLYGPSGNGKSVMAEALAHPGIDVRTGEPIPGANVLYVDAADIVSSVVGESERAIQEVFDVTRSLGECVLFLDHIELLAPARGHSSSTGVHERILSVMLQEMDGLVSCGDHDRSLMVLAATEDRHRVDRALWRPGRLELHVPVMPPDEAARREALQDRLKKAYEMDPSLHSHVFIERLVEETQGESMSNVIQRADDILLRVALDHIREAKQG